MRRLIFLLLLLPTQIALSAPKMDYSSFKKIMVDKCLCKLPLGAAELNQTSLNECLSAKTVCTPESIEKWKKDFSSQTSIASPSGGNASGAEAFLNDLIPYAQLLPANSSSTAVPFLSETGLDLSKFNSKTEASQDNLQSNVLARDFCACKIPDAANKSPSWKGYETCMSRSEKELKNKGIALTGKIDNSVIRSLRRLNPDICSNKELRVWYKNHEGDKDSELATLCSVLKDEKEIVKCEKMAEKDIKLAKECLKLFPVENDSKIATQASKRLLCFSKLENVAEAACLSDAMAHTEKFPKTYSSFDLFNKTSNKLCSQGGKKEDLDKLANCYSNAQTAKYKEEKQKIKAIESKFNACISEVGLLAKYDLNSFGTALAEQFQCVAGCEAQCKDKFENPEPYRTCAIGRLGQEAAKAVLAELAKEGGMVGALASTGMDVTSCIQPKSVTGQGEMTNPVDFCKYLDASWSSTPIDPALKNSCERDISKNCSSYASGPSKDPSLLNICANTFISCIKKNTTSAGIDSCFTKDFSSYASKEYSVERGSRDPSFKQQMCITGAALGGLDALTSAYCANEKKFPTSEAKEKCLKDARFVNEIGQAGASVAVCMESGPAPSDKIKKDRIDDKLKNNIPLDATEEAFQKTYKTKQNDRDRCLAGRLGDQGFDLLADALKLNEQQRGLLNAGKDLLAASMDCKRFDNPQNAEQIAAQKRCWTNAGFDVATGLLASQIKDPTKRAIAVGITTGARAMASCNGKPKNEMTSCLAQASLSALGQMPGTVGEVAKLANATKTVFESFKGCKGGADQRECVMNQVASILPGNAGVYSKFALKAYSLLKQDTTCKTPSKFLFKASGVVGLTGDVATQILHQAQTNKMKKEFGSMVADEKARSDSGLFENVAGFVNKNNKKREEEKVEEGTTGNIQLRAIQFQKKNEENVLQKQQINRPFYYTSLTLNTAGTVVATIEALKSWTPDGIAQSTCEKALAAKNAAKLIGLHEEKNIYELSADSNKEIVNTLNELKFASINRDLNPLSFKEAYAHYMDIQRFSEGDLSSMSLSDYENISSLEGVIEDEQTLIDTLRYIVSNEFRALSNASAFGLGAIENIGVTMVQGLFPGKKGFDSLEPGAYAEQITYQIIKTGLDKICGQKERAGGTCQYTGKAALELGAKVAAKSLLLANRALTNKVMASSFGRIVTGAQHAYNLTKTVVENERMIKDQKNRIKVLKEIENKTSTENAGDLVIEADDKAIPGTEEKIIFIDWNKYLKTELIASAFASVPKDSKTNMTLCLNKDQELDLKCSCKSTGCYEVFPMKDKKLQLEMQKIAAYNPKVHAETSSKISHVSSITNQLLSGNIGSEEIDIEEMKKSHESLSRVQASLFKTLNTMLITNKQKPLDLEKEVKEGDKLMYASLDPALASAINNMGMDGSDNDAGQATARLPELADAVKDSPENSEPVAKIQTAEPTSPEVLVLTEEQKKAAELKAELDSKYEENMNAEFEIQDINGSKSDSIFDQISKQYKRKQLEP